MKYLFSYIVSLLIFTSCPVSGQVTSEGQQQLINDKVNVSGSAVTFFSMEDNRRTLLLRNLRSGNTVSFDNVAGETVLTDKDLYFKDSFKNLIRFSLADNILDTIKQTDEFHYNNNDDMLYLYSREKQLLEMRRAESLKLVASYQVIQYSFSDDFKQLLLHRTDGSFQLLDLKNQKKILVWTPDKPFQSWSKAVWANNKVFVLFSNEREIILQTIGFSDINTEQLFKLPPNEDSWQIDASLNGLRRINDSVWIVGLRQLIANLDKVKPQVWRGSDK